MSSTCQTSDSLSDLHERITELERKLHDYKKIEKKLQISEERLRDIMDNSSDLIMIIGPDFHLMYANRSLQKELGCKECEIQDISMMDVIHPSRIDSCQVKFSKLLEGEDVGPIETLFQVKGGRTISVEGRCNVKVVHGKPVCIRGIFRDTTVQKQLQEELQQAQKLESIGILAGGTAHDFNNLLAGLSGVISVIRSSLPDDDPRREVLAEALESCMAGKEITSKFITFAEGGAPIKERTKVDSLLKDAVESSLSRFATQADFHLADDLWEADVDSAQFQHLIKNIATNGCEAMSGEGTLTVSTENVLFDQENGSMLKNGKYIKIDIQDQGRGISSENMDKMFLPYFTTKKRANVKGIGLGLTVCSSIIKGHKGKITVDSIENEGTTVHIYLPASTAS